MAQTAANLVEHVLPIVPLRQFVVTFPFELCARLAYDGKLLAAITRIAVDSGLGFYKRRTRDVYHIAGQSGSVTVMGLAVKVLDFGISKLIGPQYPNAALSMTDMSALMGSPMYMSPEQLQSTRNVDNRTDIWSLGIILFELLTGRSPFVGESLTELVLNIAGKPPKSVHELRQEIPAGLAAIIDKCLRKNRTERYSTVGELAPALARYGSKRSQASVERVLGIIENAGSIANSASLSPTLQGLGSGCLGVGQAKLTRGLITANARRARQLSGFLGFFSALGLALFAWNTVHRAAARGRTVTPTTVVAAAASVIKAPSPPAPVGNAFTANVPRTAPEANSFIASAIAPATASAAKNNHDKSSMRNANVADPRVKGLITTSEAKSSTQTKLPVSSSSTRRTGCNPPYNLDTLGRKHFKRECYLNVNQTS